MPEHTLRRPHKVLDIDVCKDAPAGEATLPTYVEWPACIPHCSSIDRAITARRFRGHGFCKDLDRRPAADLRGCPPTTYSTLDICVVGLAAPLS